MLYEVITISAVVAWLAGRCLSSATVGDLPMQAEKIAEAVTATAETGVDYVKVGLFADSNLEGCLNKLEVMLTDIKRPVIGVLFADQLVASRSTSVGLSAYNRAAFAVGSYNFV